MPHRTCAVVDCVNNARQLTLWCSRVCTIHNSNFGSEGCTCPPPFLLFPFPSEKEKPELFRLWVKMVNRTEGKGKIWLPKISSSICSDHFGDGEPSESNPYPTKRLGYELKASDIPHRRPVRRKLFVPKRTVPIRPLKKAKLSATISSDSGHHTSQLPTTNDEEQNDYEHHDDMLDFPDMLPLALPQETVEITCNEMQTLNLPCVSPPLDEDNVFHTSSSCQNCGIKDEEISRLKTKIDKLQKLLGKNCKASSGRFSHLNISKDKDIQFYTGLPNRKCFDDLYQILQPKARKLRYWRGPAVVSSKVKRKFSIFPKSPRKSSNERKLVLKDEFLLTPVRLRVGLLEKDLAHRLGMSLAGVSRILITWIKFLARELKGLIFVPPAEVVQEHRPPAFKEYPKVKHIIDCSEVFTEQSDDPMIQAATWSSYKHHNTVKFLVSITPTGYICFKSHLWGGRTSDRHLTQNCGFLDILERDEDVMADRGFTIEEDLALRFCRLHIPPAKHGKEQMTKAEVKKTKSIANTRIFVEQAIRRMKYFRILKYEVPISVVPQLDDITTICAALCNLRAPLCS
ncbi:uncharacterized protein LOC135484973 [Lineus longissimus]|uniref:uncharacterized protein LOC135484973 n=1 Tax=Lineus longissimus TaxID=88925 RepID=UPI002B4D0790